jgi:hypothetical protein
MPTLDRITIYPVKSLDGVEVEEARVLACGALEHDRRWRLVDGDGRVMNAKRSAVFAAVRAEFDLYARRLTLSVDERLLAARALCAADLGRLSGLARESFAIVPGRGGPCGWLAEALGGDVLLEERVEGGFPDDRESPGPTLVATASLAEVARWFGLELGEVRRRFRMNLEIGGCDAFWEDTLASPAREPPPPSLFELPEGLTIDPYADLPPLEPREFSVGEVRFVATNVCRRCVVPSRDSRSGAVTEHFRDAFEAWRRRGLRPDVDAAGWGGLFRLGVNTQVRSVGRGIRSGDDLGSIPLRSDDNALA